MSNLLEETLEKLKDHGKTPNDVLWVGDRLEYAISWDDFALIADINYDDGFGRQEIASDLLIVGDNWWLYRNEYDGSEWWVYNSPPIKPQNPKKFSKVDDGCWNNISELNPSS